MKAGDQRYQFLTIFILSRTPIKSVNFIEAIEFQIL